MREETASGLQNGVEKRVSERKGEREKERERGRESRRERERSREREGGTREETMNGGVICNGISWQQWCIVWQNGRIVVC